MKTLSLLFALLICNAVSYAASCDWKSRISYLYVNDTCDQYPGKEENRVDGVQAWLSLTDYNEYYYTIYTWTINGDTVLKSIGANYLSRHLPNGTYNVCVSIHDTIGGCDTTICRTVTVNCSFKCNWKKRIQSFHLDDTCHSTCVPNGIIGWINLNSYAFYQSKLEWTVDGVVQSTTSSILFPTWRSTHNVCLTIRDTVLQCDTTICKTVMVDCRSNDCYVGDQPRIDAYDSCQGEAIRAVAMLGGGPVAAAVTWTVNGITVPSKSYNSAVMEDFHISQNGSYTICARLLDTMFNNCDTTICKIIQTHCNDLGISGRYKSSIEIYPNPAGDYASLSIDSDQGEYIMFDALGNILLSGILQAGINTIRVAELASGIYVVKVWDGNVSRYARLVVRR